MDGPARLVFHPYLNHFPVAFFILEAFLLALWAWKKDEAYERFAFLTLKLAMSAMPLVMLAGVVDAGRLAPMIRPHFFAAIALFSVGFLRLVWRWRRGRSVWEKPAFYFYVFGVFLSVGLTILTGHLGGRLVY